jgi:hypothetical protein
MKDLTEVASISGKGGLYKVLKPGRSGVILESLDEKKMRMVTNPTHKVSILAEISVYTTTEDGAAPLEDLLRKIYREFGDDPGVDSKSTPEELMSFLEYILPEYDTARVYPSDVKKLVNWYGILVKVAPELLKEKTEEKKDKKESAKGEKPTTQTERKKETKGYKKIEKEEEPSEISTEELNQKKKSTTNKKQDS